MKKRKTEGEGEFAALREFVRGYLNQDFADEYGSAAAAARAFCEDASENERAQVAKEWKVFVDGTAGMDANGVNRKLAELGAGWSLTSVSELGDVTVALEKFAQK
jgi:contact-dependent growth inhibition (CDI) system CdiI-like immunity protein